MEEQKKVFLKCYQQDTNAHKHKLHVTHASENHKRNSYVVSK